MATSLKTLAAQGAAAAPLVASVTPPALADDGVAAISDAFYAKLNEMMVGTPVATDIQPLWLDAKGATAMHPIGGRESGLEALLGAFDAVASLATGGEIRIDDRAIAVFGDTAIETGVDRGVAVLAGDEIELEYRVTNVYLRTDDGWRMVHHHTDTSAPIIDLLRRLDG